MFRWGLFIAAFIGVCYYITNYQQDAQSHVENTKKIALASAESVGNAINGVGESPDVEQAKKLAEGNATAAALGSARSMSQTEVKAEPMIEKANSAPVAKIVKKAKPSTHKAKAAKKSKKPKAKVAQPKNDAPQDDMPPAGADDDLDSVDFSAVEKRKNEVTQVKAQDVKDSRWVQDKRTAIGMVKQYEDRDCRTGNVRCAERQDVNGIAVVGVVVDPDTLKTRNPAPVVKGEWKQGNYVENQPVVYLK